jgi:hypothetical protein
MRHTYVEGVVAVGGLQAPLLLALLKHFPLAELLAHLRHLQSARRLLLLAHVLAVAVHLEGGEG